MRLRRRAAIVLALVVAQTLTYACVNRLEWKPSIALPLTRLDAAVPFWPSTTALYGMLLASGPLLALLVRRSDLFARMLLAYGISVLIAFTTHAAWPTHYPRPAPSGSESPDALYRLLVAIDSPRSCFPSLHVVVPVVACWHVFLDRRWSWPIACVAVLSPTVLTTKQHYVADVLGGAAVAALGIAATSIRRGPARPPMIEVGPETRLRAGSPR